MVDTVRTLAALQALLADNTSGDISEQDIRDMLVSLAGEKILSTATTPIYNDYRVSGDALGKGGSAPTLTNFRDNIDLFAFGGAGMEEGFFNFHFLHDIKQGTTPTFHVHWAHIIGAPSGNVKWNVEYSIAKGYGTSPFGAAVTLSTIQTAPAQYVHAITDDTDMPLAAITEIEPDCLIIGRLFRDGADGDDTFANDAYLIELDMHYEIGQIATEERNRPFTSAGF